MSKPGAILTYGHTGLSVQCAVPARFCHVLILWFPLRLGLTSFGGPTAHLGYGH